MINKKLQSPIRLPKSERLSSRKAIERLLASGITENCFPYRAYWQISDPPPTIRVAISIPKKKIKRAVDRNLLRRRTRELFRHLKPGLLEVLDPAKSHGVSMDVFIMYTSDEVLDFSHLASGMNKLMKKLSGQVHEKGI